MGLLDRKGKGILNSGPGCSGACGKEEKSELSPEQQVEVKAVLGRVRERTCPDNRTKLAEIRELTAEEKEIVDAFVKTYKGRAAKRVGDVDSDCRELRKGFELAMSVLLDANSTGTFSMEVNKLEMEGTLPKT